LISLYFGDVSTLAIWFKQWAHQVAEVRANILHQTSNQLTDLLAPMAHDLEQFYNLIFQILDKIKEVKVGEK
jgi:hypothetical protein